jgi:hypothetical protein
MQNVTVMADMIINKSSDKKVAVVVTFLLPKL